MPSGLVGLTLAHTLASTLLQSGEAGLLSLCLLPTESEPRPGLRLTWAHGLHELGMDLLGDMLLAVLPSAGYRAADASGAALASLRRIDMAGMTGMAGREGGAGAERLLLGYRGTGRGDSYDDGDRRPDPASGLHPGLAEPIQIGDRLLLSGDAPAALAAYDMAAQSPSLRSLALGRRRQLLLTAPERHDEAAALCRAALEERPDHAEARLGLAAVAFGRGDYGEAAAHYRELAAGAGRTSEERALALLSAARCALTEGAHTLAQRTAEEARACLAELGPGAEVAPLELAVDQVLASALAPLAPQRARRPSPVVRPEAPLSPTHRQLLDRLEGLPPATALGELRAALPDGADAPRPLLLKAAALCQELGDLTAARRYLESVGDHPEALHARGGIPCRQCAAGQRGARAALAAEHVATRTVLGVGQCQQFVARGAQLHHQRIAVAGAIAAVAGGHQGFAHALQHLHAVADAIEQIVDVAGAGIEARRGEEVGRIVEGGIDLLARGQTGLGGRQKVGR